MMQGWDLREISLYLHRLSQGTELEQHVYREYFPAGHLAYSFGDRRACAHRIRSELAHGAWALVDGQLRRVSHESPAKARADLYPPD